MSTTSILGITEVGESQNNKYVTINNAIVALEQAANRGLEETSVGAGPWAVTEAEATRYFVFRASGASAAFDIEMPSQINSVNTSRVFTVINEDGTYTATVKASSGAGAEVDLLPGESGMFYQDYEDVYLLSKGAAASSPPYDVGLYIPGQPGDGAEVFKFVAVRAVEWPDDFAGSYGHVGTNPASSAVFTIKKNGTSIGSITISTGGTFTFATTATTTTLAAGDRLTIEAPSPQDANLADVGFNLAGYRA